MTKLYNNYPKEIHQLAEKYIEEHIIQYANSLVCDLLQASWEVSGIYHAGMNENSIENLYRSDESIIAYYELNGSTEEIEEAIQEIRDNGEDKLEVHEWWQISSSLYDQLRFMDEVVLKSSYGYFWGRTCTGQSVIMDGTFQKIVKQYV